MQDTPVGIPETKYAWNGDVALAYQVFGDGPVDLVYVEGYASHVDMNWESPRFARFLKGLARHARLIVTDRRGYGCSDRFSPFDIPASETIVDDVFAVMDAVGSDRAAIFATNWSGFAAQAAASHPDRVAALILESPIVTWIATDETPVGVTSEHLDWVAEEVRANWGSPAFPRGAEQDQAEKDWFVRWQRASISPGSLVAEVRRWKETDVRRILPSIHVPTLVIVDPDASELWDPENGRDRRFVPVTSEHLHTEIVRPTLVLLADERLSGIDDLYRKSFDRVLSGDPSGAITASTAAVEEMFRILLHSMKGQTLGPLAEKARADGLISPAVEEFTKKLYALREDSDAHQSGTSEFNLAMLAIHLSGSILLYLEATTA